MHWCYVNLDLDLPSNADILLSINEHPNPFWVHWLPAHIIAFSSHTCNYAYFFDFDTVAVQ